MRKVIAAVAVTMALSGCGSMQYKQSNAVLIEHGDTKEQVVARMGMPGDRQFSGKIEAWQWCNTGQFSDDYLIVWFKDGKVLGQQSYKNNGGIGDCTSFFRQVDFDLAPDVTIGVQAR